MRFVLTKLDFSSGCLLLSLAVYVVKLKLVNTASSAHSGAFESEPESMFSLADATSSGRSKLKTKNDSTEHNVLWYCTRWHIVALHMGPGSDRLRLQQE